MTRFLAVYVVLVSILCFVSLSPTPQTTPRKKYKYFDDYLSHMDTRLKSLITEDKIPRTPLESEGSGEVEQQDQPAQDDDILFQRPLPYRSAVPDSKEVSCCMLGQLAGDKGYHCYAKFYAGRMIVRNYNRVQNKKIAGLQPRFFGTTVQKSADKLMRTFQQCVTGPRSMIFNKCCQIAAVESTPTMRTVVKLRSDNRVATKL